MTQNLVQDVAGAGIAEASRVIDHPAWGALKGSVEEIRPWQSADGSVDFEAEGAPARSAVDAVLDRVIAAIADLSPLLPHDAAYHRALAGDLRAWSESGFGVPDFLDSLLAFEPAQ